ncbi:TetR/AcrR family transcriptional regulator [Allokutzneria sp. NRRL B-24872]|uniref:TetR/AcrR family transcriptional regulator n=1 Tax=Allokutzneria sp. NRRL B-24872 TaxID=1137961 RepID=UPI0011784600|nr:TetR/AcrR family transcriptional regulator [Allokutzneria sp. NRRL B-24872]
MTTGKPRLPRAQRREQILAAATKAFSRNGFAATSLDEIATEAEVSRMILYRHFESKGDLFRAALDRALDRMTAATDVEVGARSVRELVRWAAAEPEEFLVLFSWAEREPEHAERALRAREAMESEVLERIAREVGDGPSSRWAARLAVATCLEAIVLWLRESAPEPDVAITRITTIVTSIVDSVGRS